MYSLPGIFFKDYYIIDNQNNILYSTSQCNRWENETNMLLHNIQESDNTFKQQRVPCFH